LDRRVGLAPREAELACGRSGAPWVGCLLASAYVSMGPMLVILAIFTLFHLAVATACLGMGVRLFTEEERAHWRSIPALRVAQILCWSYPIAALVGASFAWRAYAAALRYAIPVMLAPVLWLLAMGLVFAIVDFAEDGIVGNARSRD